MITTISWFKEDVHLDVIAGGAMKDVLLSKQIGKRARLTHFPIMLSKSVVSSFVCSVLDVGGSVYAHKSYQDQESKTMESDPGEFRNGTVS
jgi:hypothetical protein